VGAPQSTGQAAADVVPAQEEIAVPVAFDRFMNLHSGQKDIDNKGRRAGRASLYFRLHQFNCVKLLTLLKRPDWYSYDD